MEAAGQGTATGEGGLGGAPREMPQDTPQDTPHDTPQDTPTETPEGEADYVTKGEAEAITRLVRPSVRTSTKEQMVQNPVYSPRTTVEQPATEQVPNAGRDIKYYPDTTLPPWASISETQSWLSDQFETLGTRFASIKASSVANSPGGVSSQWIRHLGSLCDVMQSRTNYWFGSDEANAVKIREGISNYLNMLDQCGVDVLRGPCKGLEIFLNAEKCFCGKVRSQRQKNPSPSAEGKRKSPRGRGRGNRVPNYAHQPFDINKFIYKGGGDADVGSDVTMVTEARQAVSRKLSLADDSPTKGHSKPRRKAKRSAPAATTAGQNSGTKTKGSDQPAKLRPGDNGLTVEALAADNSPTAGSNADKAAAPSSPGASTGGYSAMFKRSKGGRASPGPSPPPDITAPINVPPLKAPSPKKAHARSPTSPKSPTSPSSGRRTSYSEINEYKKAVKSSSPTRSPSPDRSYMGPIGGSKGSRRRRGKKDQTSPEQIGRPGWVKSTHAHSIEVKSKSKPGDVGLGASAAAKSPEKTAVAIGNRVSLNSGKTGTVRYIGKTAFKRGAWVGVELDEAFTGKHNGVVDGIEYFQCENNDMGGVFVKEEVLAILRRSKGEKQVWQRLASSQRKRSKSPSKLNLYQANRIGYKLKSVCFRATDLGGEKFSPVVSWLDTNKVNLASQDMPFKELKKSFRKIGVTRRLVPDTEMDAILSYLENLSRGRVAHRRGIGASDLETMKSVNLQVLYDLLTGVLEEEENRRQEEAIKAAKQAKGAARMSNYSFLRKSPRHLSVKSMSDFRPASPRSSFGRSPRGRTASQPTINAMRQDRPNSSTSVDINNDQELLGAIKDGLEFVWQMQSNSPSANSVKRSPSSSSTATGSPRPGIRRHASAPAKKDREVQLSTSKGSSPQAPTATVPPHTQSASASGEAHIPKPKRRPPKLIPQKVVVGNGVVSSKTARNPSLVEQILGPPPSPL